jgi:light-regulated signal transduction histidine kinase (bacteriophytochrome)
MSEKLGFLAHEQRNFLNNAILAFAAIKTGAVATNGATAAVLDGALSACATSSMARLADVRLAAAVAPNIEEIRADRFIAELQVAANLEAAGRGCSLKVAAFEITSSRSAPTGSCCIRDLQSAAERVQVHASGHASPSQHARRRDRVLIHVEDCCGGLPPGKAHSLFRMFEQHGTDRSGLGLGLSISRRAVETCSGSLSVRDKPGIGCVFTIDVPRFEPPAPTVGAVPLRKDQ